ncbi:hypothetical protein HYS48_00635 [Candidatus Woesearchaeota archaeon]|nr:hypothetical protein [Candidatus Woesearchaeota archaeon]
MKLWICLVVFGIALAGCVQETQVVIPQAQQRPAAPQEQPVPAAVPEEQQQDVQQPLPPIEKSAEQKKIEKILGDFENRVKSYRYVYRDPRDDHSIRLPFAGEFSVKGNRIKIVLLAPDADMSARLANIGSSDTVVYRKQLYDEDYFDVVYLNTATKKAVGVCMSQLCPEPGKQIPLKYEYYIRKTPRDWVLEMPLDKAKIAEDKMIMDKQIAIMEYPGEEDSVRLWIEHYSGLPIQVDYTKDGAERKILFEQLTINQVRDSDFEIGI